MAEGIELLFGPLLIGALLNCILYGMMVVQTFIYFQTYKDDNRWIKMFVLYLLFCETSNMVCVIGIIYEPLIIRYGTPHAVTYTPILLSSAPASTVMISTPVELFIARRVKVMGKSAVVPAIISFFAIAAFAGGIATAVLVRIFNQYADIRDKFAGAPITWLASSAAADVTISASLVYSLSRRRTGFAPTDDLINGIIRLTVQTGLITSVFAVVDIVLFLASMNTTLNFIWGLPLSKLYSNSLLSTLNARGGLRAAIQNNVLFGSGDDDKYVPSHSQVVFANSYPQTRGSSSVVTVEILDSGASDQRYPKARGRSLECA